MNSDNAANFGDCPKPKKSKTSEEECCHQPNWAHLPSIIIHEIYSLLNHKDRLNASSTCKNWRQYVFHPKWWPSNTFEIAPDNLEKAKFYTGTLGKVTSRVTIKVNTLSANCTNEFIRLLKVLSRNNNLKELLIEPTHCHFAYSYNLNVTDIVRMCIPNLVKFSIGCVEDFSRSPAKYLNILSVKQANKVTHLGLASVKDCPNEYEPSYFNPILIKPFTKLQILTVDYDQVSDEFLSCLENSEELERLVVHLHGIRNGHPGTTDAAWQNFKIKHPNCQLRLTIIHAYQEIGTIHETVLKKEMPLTHLKVFFCENINMEMLECLSAFYSNSLCSLMWVDSLGKSKRSWSFASSLYDNSPDPLIIISWLCKKLEELMVYGYKYYDQNLIAIARLRGAQLKKFEITEYDVLVQPPSSTDSVNFIEDIEFHLKRPWTPRKDEDLHPVICDPIGGDSDEYLLPIVLADLH